MVSLLGTQVHCVCNIANGCQTVQTVFVTPATGEDAVASVCLLQATASVTRDESQLRVSQLDVHRTSYYNSLRYICKLTVTWTRASI